VREAVHVAGSKNKAPAQLERILSQFMLGVAGGLGSRPGERVVLAQEVEQARALQVERPIGLAFFIDQQGKGDAGLFPEVAGILAIAEADRRESRSAIAEARFVGAQLRDVLAAENSPIVAEEDQDRGLAEPQRSEAKFAPVAVGQLDHGQPAVERRFHASIVTWAAGRFKPHGEGRKGTIFRPSRILDR